MKKIIALLMLIMISSPVLAEVTAPQWSEFCPEKYLNAEYKKPTIWDYWFSFSREPKNYWALRRKSFNDTIELCNQSSDKPTCYMQIRILEENKTANRQNQQNAYTANALNIMNTTQTNNKLNNINQNLNTIRFNQTLNGIQNGNYNNNYRYGY